MSDVKSKIKFSIIIPCGAYHKLMDVIYTHLFSKVRSIEDCEVILVDNSISDGLRKWCDQKTNIIYLKEDRRGPSYARNTGANYANGETLIFVDDDVIIHTEWIREIEKLIKSKPWISAVSGSLIPEKMKDNFLFEFRKKIHAKATDNKSNYLCGSPIFPVMNSSLFAIRKSVFKNIGGFCEAAPHLEDNELTIRLLRFGYHIHAMTDYIGKVFYVPDSRLTYCIRKFNKGYWLAGIQELTGYWIKIPFSEEFPFSSWQGKERIFFAFLQFIKLIGYAIGLATPKLQITFKDQYIVNMKSALIFQFEKDGVVYMLAPNIGITWFEDSLNFYRYGYYKRTMSLEEKDNLELIFHEPAKVPFKIKEGWVRERLFVEKPRLPALYKP